MNHKIAPESSEEEEETYRKPSKGAKSHGMKKSLKSSSSAPQPPLKVVHHAADTFFPMKVRLSFIESLWNSLMEKKKEISTSMRELSANIEKIGIKCQQEENSDEFPEDEDDYPQNSISIDFEHATKSSTKVNMIWKVWLNILSSKDQSMLLLSLEIHGNLKELESLPMSDKCKIIDYIYEDENVRNSWFSDWRVEDITILPWLPESGIEIKIPVERPPQINEWGSIH
jgi:hypothetical protein